MAKQPKDFQNSDSMGQILESSNKWQENWKKIEAENKKLLAEYMKDTNIATVPWLDMALFDKDVVMNVFQQTMKSLSKNIKVEHNHKSKQIDHVRSYLQSIHQQLQMKDSKAINSTILNVTHQIQWDENPFFYLLHQSYLLNEQFIKDHLSSVNTQDPHIRKTLTTYSRQLVDNLSWSSHSFVGVDDLQGAIASTVLNPMKANKAPKKRTPQASFNAHKLGVNVGTTKGKVVFQNDLFQLIQYEPTTTQVAKNPLLIVPPWTHKYYIFDINSENSFINWALESGLTIFVISWANQEKNSPQKTLTDYVIRGIKTAIDETCRMTSQKQVNVLGYCLGGTLLACAMGYVQAKRINRIASATFLATPFDYSKLDVLGIYHVEHQKNKLEDYMTLNGHLEGQYMVQAFNLLKINDLVWSSEVNHYLLGQVTFPFDILYWISDPVRMSADLHKDYLLNIFIENQLMHPKKLTIDDISINLKNLKAPLFILAAEEDHIAPWRSVYLLTQLTKSSSQQFVLSASGHHKGVFSSISPLKHHYWKADDLPKDADEWLSSAQQIPGSWWQEWRKWIDNYSDGSVPARSIAKEYIIEEAPGSYALSDHDKNILSD
jgi:polyhydroxyalkanoate synthase